MENTEDFQYLIGNQGDVYYWPCNVIHSEGINTTKEDRSCLILNIQSIHTDRINFLLGDDVPISSFYEQYIKINPINNLKICNNEVCLDY